MTLTAENEKLLDEIQGQLDRISGTLDILIRVRADALPPEERAALLAELEAVKSTDA